jgi:hypothetical protein
MMLRLCIYNLILPIILVNSIQIPYIDNNVLIPGYSSNSTLTYNQTKDQCLCLSSLSYPVINWFPNNTCQLFRVFPPTYQIQVTTGARLYFPQQLFPNASQCCMPDINYLLNKLTLATAIFANLSNPRDIFIDNLGYLVTVEMSLNFLHRFNATSLSTISRTSVQNSYQMTIAFDQGAYFIAPNNQNFMAEMNSTNLALLNNITMTGISGPRGIMFLNSGQTMVVTSNSNNSLVFFNRSSVIPSKYTFSYSLAVHNNGPHGLWRVNDSFFYATSYSNNSIYSYSTIGNSTLWNETFLFKLLKLNSTGGSTNIAIDECGRLWLPLEGSTVLIYSQEGTFLGNYTNTRFAVSFMTITSNYVMYFSDCGNNQIIRIDPQIQC